MWFGSPASHFWTNYGDTISTVNKISARYFKFKHIVEYMEKICNRTNPNFIKESENTWRLLSNTRTHVRFNGAMWTTKSLNPWKLLTRVCVVPILFRIYEKLYWQPTICDQLTEKSVYGNAITNKKKTTWQQQRQKTNV